MPAPRTERDAYIPSVAEIYERGEALRWMTSIGWAAGVVDSVMNHDCPSVDTVRFLVYRWGPDRAYDIIREIVEA